MVARKSRPPVPDSRQSWQIAQAARCGCRGSDDLCLCQNEDAPWRYGLGDRPAEVDWKARALAAEAALAPFAALARWFRDLPDDTILEVRRFNVFPHQQRDAVGPRVKDLRRAALAIPQSTEPSNG